MTRLVLKAAPDDDLYCEWTTVVDDMTFTGTRAQMFDYLCAYRRGPMQSDEDIGQHVESLLARVDQYGTSALWSCGGTDHAAAYRAFGWRDPSLIVQQRATLPRDRLGAWLRTLDDGLLEPFEDEDEVLPA